MKKEEFKQFLGIIFYSRYHIFPREKMCWENYPDTVTTVVSRAMPCNRYFKNKFYYNDNNCIDSDRYYKVRSMYDLLDGTVHRTEHLKNSLMCFPNIYVFMKELCFYEDMSETCL